MTPRGPARRSLADRAYRVLLRFYPRDFRERFGAEMTDFFRDRRAAARRAGGSLGVARAWVRATTDVLGVASLERLDGAGRSLRAARAAWSDHAFTTSDQRDEAMLVTLAGDIRYALRGMAAKRAFSGVVLGTLALGIGANVAILSVVNGVLLRPLPYRDAGRIVSVKHRPPYETVSEPEFVDYRNGVKRLDHLAAFTTGTATLTDDRDPERVTVARVSDGFFSVLGVPAAVGRTFVPEEDLRHGAPWS